MSLNYLTLVLHMKSRVTYLILPMAYHLLPTKLD